jgi:hypothetical protein
MTEEAPIPLPPLPEQPLRQTTPEQLARELSRLDWVLAGAVLVLAFLAASYAIRNGDFWFHLATGRIIAHGKYTFGVDPFSYTVGPETYWANHSWLYDLTIYGFASLLGGPESPTAGVVLAVVKALLATALAWVMMSIRRLDQSLWAPAACTGLAFIALSSRLNLQPALISMLLLAITLCILVRPRHIEGQEGEPSPLRIYWLLPVLFVLWVNVDGWFILGPITVALFLLGQVLQQFFNPIRTGPEAPEPTQNSTLLLVLLVGTAACLINPHHYHAFTLPYEISPHTPTKVLSQEAFFRQMFYKVLDDDHLNFLKSGWNLAAYAYFPLVVLGFISFVVSALGGWRWWRLLIWGAFAFLSYWQVRNIGLFAVVAAPITALNFQGFVAERSGQSARANTAWRIWSLSGRLATLLLAVAAAALAWPGWLHGLPLEGRIGSSRQYRAHWAVEADPSLSSAASQLAAWHSQGLIKSEEPAERGFNYSPEIMNYSAWFCADADGLPLEKGYYDFRFTLFPESVAERYVELRQAFREGSGEPGRAVVRASTWQEAFRKEHITHVVLSATDPTTPIVGGQAVARGLQFVQDWQQWPLLYLDGRAIICGWNDPRGRTLRKPSGLKRLDFNQWAFGPNPKRAPAAGPDEAPQVQELWDLYLHGPNPRPLDSDEALRLDQYFAEVSVPLARVPYMLSLEWCAWAGIPSASAVSPLGYTVAAPMTYLLTAPPFRGGLPIDIFRAPDVGPQAVPVLAVRAARRAIAASPNDPEAYLGLAEAYNTLWSRQEDLWTGRPADLRQLTVRQKMRQVQYATAMEYALKLRTDNVEAHYQLFKHYVGMEYYDIALEHLNSAVDQAEAAGPRVNEPESEFKGRIDALKKEVKSLDEFVGKRRNRFVLDAADKPLDTKLGLAMQSGLTARALELILAADNSQVSPSVINLELDLLLSMGRAHDAGEVMKTGMDPATRINYLRTIVFMHAARGDYAEAGRSIDEMLTFLEQNNANSYLRLVQMQVFEGGMTPGTLNGMKLLVDRVRDVAGYLVLRGLIALEEGENATAAQAFERAVAMSNGGRFDFDGRAVAFRYLQLIRSAGGTGRVAEGPIDARPPRN